LRPGAGHRGDNVPPPNADENHIRSSYDTGIVQVMADLAGEPGSAERRRVLVMINHYIDPT
jgi:hypothetical protein